MQRNFISRVNLLDATKAAEVKSVVIPDITVSLRLRCQDFFNLHVGSGIPHFEEMFNLFP